jgi:type IV fimbrial biogenesis protein FimT
MEIKRRKQRGITLGELLTVMAVIGISLSIAVPSFSNMMNNNRRITAVNRMVTTMHSARSEAITRNVQVTVCASTAGASCNGSAWKDGWLIFADLDGDRAVDAGETILGSAPGVSTLDVTSGTFSTYFVYRPNGRIMGASVDDNQGQFTICDSRGAAHARVVILSMSGQPRLSEYQSDGSTPVCS